MIPRDNFIYSVGLKSENILPGIHTLPDLQKQVNLGSGVIKSLISSGGSAVVYEIWNSDLEVSRAVKLLHPDHSKESEDRFHTEMKISAKLHHPNIVEIYGVGKWQDLPYIEMERIDGPTLDQLIHESGALPIDVAVSIAIMIGRALNYAHNQDYVIYGKVYHGIIHRDLKPHNIMVSNNGQVKLMDFGIARPLLEGIHTCDGSVMGTMQYLAPEQINGGEVDIRSDIYALGAVLYEMITGRRTFPDENLAKLVTEKLGNNFIPLDQFPIKIPNKLKGLIHRCLHNEKEHRIPNAISFLKTLSSLHHTLTNHSPEQVLREFMKSRVKQHIVINPKSKLKILSTFLILTSLSLVGISSFLIIQFFTPDIIPPNVASNKVSSKEDMLHQTKLTVAKNENSLDVKIKIDSLLSDDTTPVANYQEELSSVMPKKNIKVPKIKLEKVNLRTEMISQVGKLDEKVNDTKENEENIIAPEVVKKSTNAVSIPDKLREMRKLLSQNQKNSITEFFAKNTIDDAEYFIEKAIFLFENGQVTNAHLCMNDAQSKEAKIAEPKEILIKNLYFSALVKTYDFDKKRTVESKKNAMESWFRLKSEVRSNPEHTMFLKADSEIRRIDKETQMAAHE